MRRVEAWRPVVSYEGFYSVSNLGRVRSEHRVVGRSNQPPKTVRQRILKLRRRRGYMCVNLQKSGRQRTFNVHSLVAEAFLGPRPAGLAVLHGQLGQEMNTPENLSYGTLSQNMGHDRLRDDTLPWGEQHYKSKLTVEQVRLVRSSPESGAALARRFGVTRTTISDIRRGRTWKHIA